MIVNIVWLSLAKAAEYLDVSKDTVLRRAVEWTDEPVPGKVRTKYLVLGADTLHDLPHWHEPARVALLAELLVVPRSDWVMLSEAELRKSLSLAADVPLRMQLIHLPTVGIASRDLRRRAAEGRSLRYLVPRAIEAYIQDKHLYLS